MARRKYGRDFKKPRGVRKLQRTGITDEEVDELRKKWKNADEHAALLSAIRGIQAQPMTLEEYLAWLDAEKIRTSQGEKGGPKSDTP